MKKLSLIFILIILTGCISVNRNGSVITKDSEQKFKDAIVIQRPDEIWVFERDKATIFQNDRIKELTFTE